MPTRDFAFWGEIPAGAMSTGMLGIFFLFYNKRTHLQSYLADTHMLQINSPSVLTVFKSPLEKEKAYILTRKKVNNSAFV